MKTIFWTSILFVFYTYLGYPALLFLWSRLFSWKVTKGYFAEWPAVSIAIAVRDEEVNIEQRLRNLISLDYPVDRLEVIIVSDGSVDNTESIIERMIDEFTNDDQMRPNVRLLVSGKVKGKPNALSLAIEDAENEIIVFADARQKFEENVLKELVRNFTDERVGCVSGELKLINDLSSELEIEMSSYWSFEKKVREMETAIHSVPGATGAIYAIRKELYSKVPDDTLLDDVYIPMSIILKGYRCIFDKAAIAYDLTSENNEKEKRRKIRTLTGNWQLLLQMPCLVNPFVNAIFVQYISHKVFRLFVPFAYLAAVVAAAMANGLYYKFLMLVLLVPLFLLFVRGQSSEGGLFKKVCGISRTFTLLNYYAFLSAIYCLLPNKKDLW